MWTIIEKIFIVIRRDGIYRTINQILQILYCFIKNILVITLLRISNVDVLDRDELRKSVNENNLWEFSKLEQDNLDSSINYVEGDYDQRIQKQLKTYSINRPFVCEVNNVILDSDTGLPISDDRDFILDLFSSRRDRLERSLMDDLWKFVSLIRVDSSEYNPDYKINVACLLYTPFDDKLDSTTSNESSGPVGWVTNHLLKLQGIKKYKKETGVQPTLILPPNPNSYVIESLEALGYTSDDWITWPNRAIAVDSLVVPSTRTIEYNKHYYEYFFDSRIYHNVDYKYVSNDAMKWLKSEIYEKNSISETNTERVLIRRTDATGRQILNYDEIEDTIKSYGFKSYELSNMSFLEQVKLFANAEIIMGPTGAGFINLIYASDPKVLLLYNEHTKPTYIMISKSLGYQCGYLLCRQVGDPSYPGGCDMLVDEDKLEKIFNEMDIEMVNNHSGEVI